jgi:hypothetical protein
MSINRLNYLVMSILPFNFGMNYDDCLKFYDRFKDKFTDLCPTDPRTWTQERIDSVNKEAKEQNELADRLMALPNDEFYAEVDRLEQLKNETGFSN